MLMNGLIELVCAKMMLKQRFLPLLKH